MTAEAETTPTTAAGDAGRGGRAGIGGGWCDGRGGVVVVVVEELKPEGGADLQLHIIADS